MPETMTAEQFAEKKAAEELKQILPDRNIKRGEVEWTFVGRRVERGDNKGKPYRGFAEITKDNLPTALKWFGDEVLVSILSALGKRKAQGWSEQATDENTGKFDEDKFELFAQAFSAWGESKAELEEKQDSLTDELLAALKAGDMVKAMDLGNQIKDVKSAIAEKSKPRKQKEGNGTTVPTPTPAVPVGA